MSDSDVENIYSEYFENKTYKRVSVHDPSIVVGYYEGDTYTDSTIVYGEQDSTNSRKEVYFVFGSHMAWAYSLDLKNWQTFNNNINKNYETIFEKQGEWSKRGDKAYNISGNLWAPDVFWNGEYDNGDGTKGAWLMYMSINGCSWNSSISLLTATTLNGNWTYKDTIVYSGFNNSGTYDYEATNYKEVTGETSLPDRYKRASYTCNDGNTVCEATEWNRGYGAHAIDPCIIEDGDKLWMTYGSWSGGIWMMEMDKSTGLRKDDFKPAYKDGESDPYMGYILAGGSGVSGEASYIQKIGSKYYLFISYGGLIATGGYNMRVFSADSITGPYKDLAGHDARRSLTNGAGTVDGTVGNRLMSYYKWSFMKDGFTAEGHNSAFVDDDGKSYVIYHTRFDDGSEGHELRVHQLFQAKNGGLVTAPFEYSGEELSTSAYQTSDVAGEYKVVTMRSSDSDHKNLKCAEEQTIQLSEDGKVTGDFNGTWEQTADGPYVTLVSGGVSYQGVFLKQNIEETSYETMCMTLVGNNDVSIWGYQTFSGNVMIAKAAHDMKVSIGAMTYANLELPTNVFDGVDVEWSSSHPDIIAANGTVTAPEQNTDVTLTVTLSNGEYSYSKDYKTTVLSSIEDADTETGLKALYNFNNGMENVMNNSQSGELLAQKNGTKPSRKYNAERGSKILHQQFGYTGENNSVLTTSYAKYPNPLQNEELEGATVSLWVNCVGQVDVWDAIWSFFDEDNTDGVNGRLYLTPNMYLGYNGTGGWFDLNHADNPTGALTIDTWNLVTVSITSNTVGIYINGTLVYTYDKYNTYNDSTSAVGIGSCDKTMPLKMISSAADFYTGYGSWWGSAPLYMDNIRIYDRALNDADVLKLYVEELEEVAADVESNIVDTSGYYYYNDYNTADVSVWESLSAAGNLSLEEDAEGNHKSYIKFSFLGETSTNSRTAYTGFAGIQELPDKYTVEFDTQLTYGNNQESQLALATGAYGIGNVDNNKNYKLVSNYIWTLSTTNSTKWTVSNGDEVILPKASWIHIRTDISQSDKTAKLMITGDGVSYEGTITNLTETQVKGLFWLGGRYQSIGCFDNMRVFAYDVAFDANGGTGTMENQAFKLDNAANLKKNVFIRDGYKFTGWATSPDGDSLYSDEKSISNLSMNGGTVVLYAKWADPLQVETPEPTDPPVVTDPPIVTDPPAVTDPPEPTDPPVVTDPPEPTDPPVVPETKYTLSYTTNPDTFKNAIVSLDKTKLGKDETATLTIKPETGYEFKDGTGISVVKTSGTCTIGSQEKNSDGSYSYKISGLGTDCTVTVSAIAVPVAVTPAGEFLVTYNSTVTNADVSLTKDGKIFESGSRTAATDRIQLSVTPGKGFTFADAPVVTASNATVNIAEVTDGVYTYVILDFKGDTSIKVTGNAVPVQYSVSIQDDVKETASANNVKLSLSTTDASAGSTVQFIITPEEGFQIKSAGITAKENTCAISGSEKGANGTWIFNLSKFNGNTIISHLNIETTKTQVAESGTDTSVNIGAANLGETDFADKNISDAIISAITSKENIDIIDNETSVKLDGAKLDSAVDEINKALNQNNNVNVFVEVNEETNLDSALGGVAEDAFLNEVKSQASKDTNNNIRNSKIAMPLDISFYAAVNGVESKIKISIKDTGNREITISMSVPSHIEKESAGIERLYYAVRFHNGNKTIIPCDYNSASGKIKFKSSKFSTYVLCYVDTSKGTQTAPPVYP